MYIHSVQLINYKSLGDYPETKVIIEPTITAIIGKNESGKTNVLEGISKINIMNPSQSCFDKTLINRNSDSEASIKYIIELKDNELKDTKIIITKDKYEVTGGLSDWYFNNIYPQIASLIEELDSINNNPFKLNAQDLSNYVNIKKELLNKDSFSLPRTNKMINQLNNYFMNGEFEGKEKIENNIDDLIKDWGFFKDKIPVIFYRKNDKCLKTMYKQDEIKRELNNPSAYPTSLLSDLVNIIDVNKDDFMEACSSGSSPRQDNIRERINESINSKINEPFNEYYKTEKIKLKLTFNNGEIFTNVISDGGNLLRISERSNGLRWYLELFIDTRSNDIDTKNTVFLFDEPGISLHINAQKELLKLFRHLSQHNQIVYSTHLPSMLDLEYSGLHRIRAVVKNQQGNTFVYKNAYDANIYSDDQADTIAPIVNAIGMSLKDTFILTSNLNVVVEGISDYIYISMMKKVLNTKLNDIAFIPAVGASNIINICSILRGWGYETLALFDYDPEGFKSAEILKKKMNMELDKDYIFLKSVSEEDIQNETYKTDKYEIEDLIGKGTITYYKKSRNISVEGKSLLSKLISDGVENGQLELNEECKNNFEDLFKRIETINSIKEEN